MKYAAGHIIMLSRLLTRVFGRVAELADAPDLGSGPERDGGSNPSAPTIFYGRMIRFRGLKDMLAKLTMPPAGSGAKPYLWTWPSAPSSRRSAA